MKWTWKVVEIIALSCMCWSEELGDWSNDSSVQEIRLDDPTQSLAHSGQESDDGEVFSCRKQYFSFGLTSRMIRNAKVVLRPGDNDVSIKVPWPLVKMWLQVVGANMTVCDNSTLSAILVTTAPECSHLRIFREGGGEAFGTAFFHFGPRTNLMQPFKKTAIHLNWVKKPQELLLDSYHF